MVHSGQINKTAARAAGTLGGRAARDFALVAGGITMRLLLAGLVDLWQAHKEGNEGKALL
jgi:hypothetical protein